MRDVAILKNGPDLHGELFAALVALVKADAGALAAHLADAIKPPQCGQTGPFGQTRAST